MISMLRGSIVSKAPGEIVLMTDAGIGFRMSCSANTLAAFTKNGETVTVLTHMNVREDAIELFGFATHEERDLFRKLISVSGVGPKIAIAILGSLSINDLRLAIMTGDEKALCRAPGIGKKTAQRIALELKEQLSKDAFDASDILPSSISQGEGNAVSEALTALKMLGYTAQEAAGALRGIPAESSTTEELVRLALRRMIQKG